MTCAKSIIQVSILVLLFTPTPSFAHSAPNITVDDPVYQDIDLLIAHGLVKDVIIGQRPWSRSEIARIIEVSLKNREEQRSKLCSPPHLYPLPNGERTPNLIPSPLRERAPNFTPSPLGGEGKACPEQSRRGEGGTKKEYVDRVLERLSQKFREDISTSPADATKEGDAGQGPPDGAQNKMVPGSVFLVPGSIFVRAPAGVSRRQDPLGGIYGTSFKIHPLETFKTEFTYLDSPWRAVPQNNGIGTIDAQINPLVANRGGRHYADGSTFAIETEHSAMLSKYASLYARPRFEYLWENVGNESLKALPQNLYSKFAFGNFEFQVGRDELAWGYGEHGGLLFSNNARPLDMIKLGSTSPFRLPWFFKHIGNHRLTAFVAYMGPEGVRPHAVLSGYRWSLKPCRYFEGGVTHIITMGGTGANDPGFWEAISEFSGIIATIVNKSTDKATTNRLISIDLRFSFPPLRNLSLYAEGALEDTNDSVKTLFEDLLAYNFGLYMPRLNDSGNLKLRLDYKHIPAISYHHGFYADGFTLNRRFIGAAQGPESDSIEVKMYHDLEKVRFTYSFALEKMDSDLHSTVSNGGGGGYDDIISTQNNPSELRYRPAMEVTLPINKYDLYLGFNTGIEFSQNFNFVPGATNTNFLAGLSLTKTLHP